VPVRRGGQRDLHVQPAVRPGAGLGAVAVAFYDYETALYFSYQGDRYFHAASTIKVPVLMTVFRLEAQGKLDLEDRLHVRNRFASIADGSIYRVARDRDGDSDLYKRIGRTARILDLARAMITRSSNLATNILLDYIGIEAVRNLVDAAGVNGIKIQRGVEDETAFQLGLNNEVSADGLLRLFRLLCQNHIFEEPARRQMIEILLGQEFNNMMPARLPSTVRVAHKTGEISTVCHDAGLVFVPERKPYILSVLSETPPNAGDRQKAIARISELVFNYLTYNGTQASE